MMFYREHESASRLQQAGNSLALLSNSNITGNPFRHSIRLHYSFTSCNFIIRRFSSSLHFSSTVRICTNQIWLSDTFVSWLCYLPAHETCTMSSWYTCAVLSLCEARKTSSASISLSYMKPYITSNIVIKLNASQFWCWTSAQHICPDKYDITVSE